MNYHEKKSLSIVVSVFLIVILYLSIYSKNIHTVHKLTNIKCQSRTSLINTQNHKVIFVRFSFKNIGTIYDPLGKCGLACVTNFIVFNRINGLDEINTLKKLRKLGVWNFRVRVTGEEVIISFATRKSKFTGVMNFLGNAIFDRSITESELLEAKEYFVLNRGVLDTISVVAESRIRSHFYNGHCYGRNESGEVNDIKSITIGDVENFITKKFTSENLDISAIGNISRENMQIFIDKFVNKMTKIFAIPIIPQLPVVKTAQNCTCLKYEKKYVDFIKKENMTYYYVVIGVRMDNLNYQDYFALSVIKNMFFRWKSSPIFLSLLEHDLLCPYSFEVKQYKESCIALISFATSMEKIKDTLYLLSSEFLKYTQGCDEEMFNKTDINMQVKKLTGYSSGKILNIKSLDYVSAKVTKRNVDTVLQKLLKESPCMVVVVGPKSPFLH